MHSLVILLSILFHLFPIYVSAIERVKRAENITFVQDSGICETTSGVGQASGYINVTPRNLMFFWFFEARFSPESAPLTLWLNGGPGCSSMLGLFQEIGPCTANEDGESTSLNPYSWTNVSNVLFIDQPIGAGFSTGPAEVSSTEQAADDVWIALQVFFATEEFSAFKDNEFIIATESYGARYAPTFATYFNDQNAKIDSGELVGVKITVAALAINNGKHDPMTQIASTIPFSADAPGYGPLVDDEVLANITDAWENSCRAELEECYASDRSRKADEQCGKAISDCERDIYWPTVGTRDPSDLRQQRNSPNKIPSNAYLSYIRQNSVQNAIGVDTDYDQCNDAVKSQFTETGESGRSFLPPLAELANAKIPLLIWAGDADMKSNWIGVHDAMVAMDWYGADTLNNTSFTNLTMGGEDIASYKVVDNFTFARVFQAGHAMPAFQPAVAFEIFSQFVRKEQIHSPDSESSTNEDGGGESGGGESDGGAVGPSISTAGAMSLLSLLVFCSLAL